MASFEQWAHEAGVQRAPGHELAYRSMSEEYDGSDAGWDVYAATNVDVPAGSTVLCVPESLVFSASKAMEEFRTNDMQSAEKVLFSVNGESELRQYYLMIKLLVEYERGVDSQWFPWFNS